MADALLDSQGQNIRFSRKRAELLRAACLFGLMLAAAPGCGSPKRDFDPRSNGGSSGELAGGASPTSGSAGVHKAGSSGAGGAGGSAGEAPATDGGEGGMAGAAGEAPVTMPTGMCKDTEYFDGEACTILTACAANEFEAVPPAPDRDRVCKALTQCTAEQYSVAAAGGGDNTCVALAVCSAGNYVSGAPTATTNRACAPCASGTFSAETNVAACKAWRTCAAGEAESVAPAATSDRVCSPCGSGKYSLNGTCMPLTVCAATEYESKAATATSDRTCKAISDCAAGTSQTAAPTATTDRQCAACGANSFSTTKNAAICTAWTVCTVAQYESTAPSSTVNRACTALTSCTPGQRIKTAATATTNRVCEACPSSTYSTADNSTTCAAWTVCTAAQYQTTAPSSTVNRACTALTNCTPGQRIKTAATATTNRVCEACPSSTYSTANNSSTCAAWTTCGTGQGETTAGTTISDRVCATCTAGTSATGGKCVACAPGTFSSTAGATSCTTCGSCAWLSSTGCTATTDRVCTKTDIVRQVGGTGSEYGRGVAIDGSNNVWLATNANSDVVLHKYDLAGTKVKTVTLATSGTDEVSRMVSDTAGNIWIAGTTTGALAGTNPSGATQAFVARFAPDGTAKGLIQFGNSFGATIAAGTSGDVWLSFGTLITHVTDSGGSLVYSTPGDLTTGAATLPGMGGPSALTVDQNGNPWATGYFDSGIYVWKGSSGGSVNSSNCRIGAWGTDGGMLSVLAIQAKGTNVWVIGTIRGARYDSTDASVPAGGFGDTDILVHRFTANDAQAHEVTQAGSSGLDYGNNAFLDSKGDLWITGQVGARNANLITFNGKTTKGALDLMAWRFTVPSGAGKATPTTEYYMVGTDQDDYPGFGAIDSSGRLWIAGSTTGQFPGGPANAGESDAFVAQVGK